MLSISWLIFGLRVEAQVTGPCGEPVNLPGSISEFVAQMQEEAKEVDDPGYAKTRAQSMAQQLAAVESFNTGIGPCKKNLDYSTSHTICSAVGEEKCRGALLPVNRLSSNGQHILAGNGEASAHSDFHTRQKNLQIGDILTPDLAETLHLHQGDMVYLKPSGFLQVSDTQTWAAWSLWPNAKVPYTFATGTDFCAKESTRAAISVLEQNTCIRFTEVDINTAASQIVLQVQSSAQGCWGYVGYSNNAMINLGGDGCQVSGIALHELGLLHVQSRMDRDSYVTVNWNNIETGDGDNFVRVKTKATWSTLALAQAYDYGSVMHYGACEFSVSSSRDPTSCATTIKPANASMTYLMGNRDHLSVSDVKLLNQMYGCTATCADGVKNQGELGIDCGGPCAKQCSSTAPSGSVNATGIYTVASQCQISRSLESTEWMEIAAIAGGSAAAVIVLGGLIYRYWWRRGQLAQPPRVLVASNQDRTAPVIPQV
jgi:Astacin (Peptidase family M12A)